MAGVGTKEIKRRKASIESTRQITSAMNLVSSSKLMKAREKQKDQNHMRMNYTI